MNYKFLDQRHLVPLLIAVFLLSGFSGLIYQSIWTHYLKLFLGHAAYAQSLVLATFMGGLAAGSWWAARLTRGSRQLLLWYALAEAAVGLYALVFHQAFVQMVDFVFAGLLPGMESVLAAQLVKWSLALALIMPPSILLGTTFPLMAEGLIRRRPEQRGHLLGLLYFSNSLGAAVGVLTSGFLLIRWLGLEATVFTAGILNLLVAAIVLLAIFCSKAREQPIAVESGSGLIAVSHKRVQLLLLGCAGLTGLASFIYELTWIRMLNMVLGSATHSFELMLASFLLGLALGGWWIRRRIDGLENPLRRLAWIQLLMGLFAAATVVLYNQLFDLMALLMTGLAKTVEGYVLFKLGSMGLAMLVMLPATLCAGMTLPLITASLSGYGYDERAVGHVYAVNTLGAILGVIVTAGVLIPVLGLRLTLLSGAAIDVVLAVCLVGAAATGLAGRWPLGFALAGVLGLGLILQLFSFDAGKMSSSVFRKGRVASQQTEVLFHRDGRSATVAVRSSADDMLSIATNGKADAAMLPLDSTATGDEHTMIMLGVLSMALQPAAKDVAVIGFGSGLTTHTLLGNPQLQRVDTIEIEPAMVEGARYFGARVERAFADPRSKIFFEDARTYFSTRRRHYDLIISEPSNPWVSGVAGLFSHEHYQRIKRHLKPGGVYVQWLQLYEFNVSLAASVLKAFSRNFSDYVVYQGGGGDLLIAGVAEGQLGAMQAGFLKEADLRGDLDRIGIKTLADIAARLVASKALLAPFLAANPTPANSDYFPYLDQHAEQTRYLDTNAKELLDLNRIWLLTNNRRQRVVLGQHSAGRKTELTKKFQDARFLQTMFKDNLELQRFGEAKLPIVAYESAISVSRLLYRCNPSMVERSWLGDAVWLSDITSIYGVPGLITPFWRSLLENECFESLPGHVQAAFRFFMAASERDNMEILREGGLTIDYNFDVPGFRNYRILHMLAAFHRLNRPIEAAKFVYKLKDKDELSLEARVLAAYLVDQAREMSRQKSAGKGSSPMVPGGGRAL
ncbi:MAG: fused MFS/spermidine synthase [Gammaproteobacteria bacterium]|nr:fused MFS/spermidine synthase [Gammaproteobacteria bacterium]